MEKAEARKKLKGLQLLVHNRADEDLLQVFDDVEAYIARERPQRNTTVDEAEADDQHAERSEKKTRDRRFKGGRDRGAE